MLNKFSNLAGVKILSMSEQKELKGGVLQMCNSSFPCCSGGAACICGPGCDPNPEYSGGGNINCTADKYGHINCPES